MGKGGPPSCQWECKLEHPPWRTVRKVLRKLKIGTGLVVQWLKLQASTAGSSIPHKGAKIPKAAPPTHTHTHTHTTEPPYDPAIQFLGTCLTLRPRGLQPARLLCPWDSPGRNTGVGGLPSSRGLPDPGSNLPPLGLCVGRWVLTTSATCHQFPCCSQTKIYLISCDKL